MDVLLHPPKAITVRGELPEDTRRRLNSALLAAVASALADAAASGGAVSPVPVPADPREVAEAFDPTRLDRASPAYLIPSYDDGGAPALFEEDAREVPEPRVVEGPSPFEGQLLVKLPGLRFVFLRSKRFVVTGSLVQAILLGQDVFGTTSFAVFSAQEAPDQPLRYWAVGTDPPLSSADVGRTAGRYTLPGGPESPLNVLTGAVIPIQRYRIGDVLYRTVAVAGTDRDPNGDRMVIWWTEQAAAEYFGRLRFEQRTGIAALPAGIAALIFADIDPLVGQVEAGSEDRLQAAAEKLSLLDRKAFALVDWQTKARYLKVLLRAWTWQEQEKAVVEIFASLRSDSEVDAVVEMLRAAGVYDKLFNDLDSELYTLLTEVGERFAREKGPLTFDGLVGLLQEFGLIPRTMQDALRAAVFGPAGLTVPSAMVDEAYDAAMGLVRFGADLGEGIATVFTEPGKIAEGIVALVQLLLKAQLASMGYLPALQEISALLAKLASEMLAGMRGAERLGCGEKILRRLKWRLVWEIASLLVGVGEVKAAVQALGITEKLAGVLRFLGVLSRLGEVADAETLAVRLVRLAALGKAERAVFASVEEVAELLGRLPENDVRELGSLLSRLDLREGETLADLARRNAELHNAVRDALEKAELLKTLAGKSGGLTDAVVEAFHGLLGEKGLALEDASRVIKAIPDGEGARFAAALRTVPLGRVAAEARAAFLELLAASPRRMDAMARFGYESFAALYRRAGGAAERFDRYLAVVEELERQLAGQGRSAEFRLLLDGLERGDPAAWLRVENARAVRAGQRALDEWLAMAAGSPRAQAGLDRLLRRDQGALVHALVDNLSGEPEVLLALEEIGAMGERELEGLLELRRYLARDGDFLAWNEILFTEPGRRQGLLEAIAGLRDPANPQALVIRSGLDEVLEAALRQRNVQGGMGHLQTVEALLREFPGARFDLEVTRITGGAWREVDIVMTIGGRQIEVEVKSYQVTTDLDHARRQISKDLVRHLTDPGGPWSDLLWRFPDPGYAANFPRVRELFLEELRDLAASGRLPIPLPQAEAALRSRFTAGPPWNLLDILH